MSEAHSLSETALAREALKRLCDEKGVLHRAAHVLELVAHSSVGLGEVLQDYAHQASGQLTEVFRAAEHLSHDATEPGDALVLANIHFVLKAVKAVLEMTPAAMQRNKADALGEKEKLPRADIAQLTHAFLHSPDIARLLAAEDAGSAFADVAAHADSGGPTPGQNHVFAAASH